MIVSVSRRCDIPRFQFNWFTERLDAGFADVANPFNAGQIRRVSLLPGDVDAFVFWTRDPRHILAGADDLTERGFPFYVMVTVTGYPVELEPDMARTREVLTSMKALSRKTGPDRVIWRYDPVLLTDLTDEDFHRKNFSTLAGELAGSVRRVVISIYDGYRGAKRRMEALERAGVLRLSDSGDGKAAGFAELLTGFAEGAEAAGMEIQSCAEEGDFSPYGIKHGACIDAELINKLWGLEFKGKDKNQRPHCLCCKSVDIGSYGICPARCVYCYAW
jgi:hypothetical protein